MSHTGVFSPTTAMLQTAERRILGIARRWGGIPNTENMPPVPFIRNKMVRTSDVGKNRAEQDATIALALVNMQEKDHLQTSKLQLNVGPAAPPPPAETKLQKSDGAGRYGAQSGRRAPVKVATIPTGRPTQQRRA